MPTDGHNDAENAQEEFVGLFSLHSRRVYSFILTLVVHPQEADEVFQNTSLVLWKKFGDYVPGTSFWAWACQVAYYEVLRFRQTSHHGVVFSDEALHHIATSMLAREEQTSLLESALHDCLKRLASKDRDMIELRYFHEKAPKQIADLQSRSVHSVYRALSRIHEQLHRCINRFITSESGQ